MNTTKAKKLRAARKAIKAQVKQRREVISKNSAAYNEIMNKMKLRKCLINPDMVCNYEFKCKTCPNIDTSSYNTYVERARRKKRALLASKRIKRKKETEE